MPATAKHVTPLRLLGGLLVVVALSVTGCSSTPPPPTRDPMDVHAILSESGHGGRAVVMLPGREDKPLDLVDNGFVEPLRTIYPDVDIFIPDAHRGYYEDSSIVERLDQDLLAPLRARGYERIYVVGISMGGVGALLHARLFPENVDGLVLIAPYLGEEDLVERIRQSGGIRAWDGPRPEPGNPLGEFKEIWGWFSEWPAQRPDMPIYLAYGRSDRHAEANGMLATLLPQGTTFTAKGGHEWLVWRNLWRQVLSRGVLMTDP